MAKRIGVLDADESLSARPGRYVSKSVAAYLVRKCLALPVGPRLIKMLKEHAAQIVAEVTRSRYWDGPLGRGNILPFSPPTDASKKHHYEIPMAGHKGLMCRHGLRRKKGIAPDADGLIAGARSELTTRTIRVSRRNLFAKQVLMAV